MNPAPPVTITRRVAIANRILPLPADYPIRVTTSAAASPIVLIVAYRSDDHLLDCLVALGGSRAVTVIDNEGSASTQELVSAAGARYVAAPANVGFAAAVNL